MAPDGEIRTQTGWITEYRVAWYHQQGQTPITHQGLPFYTIKIGSPLLSERSRFYEIGRYQRAEVYCGALYMVLACNYNHDDEVLFNHDVQEARIGRNEVIWDNRRDVHREGPLNLKFHRARDDSGSRFVDLYMHIWIDNQPVSILIIGKKTVNGDRAPLSNDERMRLGIPQWAWDATAEAQQNPNDRMINYVTQGLQTM